MANLSEEQIQQTAESLQGTIAAMNVNVEDAMKIVMRLLQIVNARARGLTF